MTTPRPQRNVNPFAAASRSFQLGDTVDCGGVQGVVSRIEDGCVYAERDGNEWLVARLPRGARVVLNDN